MPNVCVIAQCIHHGARRPCDLSSARERLSGYPCWLAATGRGITEQPSLSKRIIDMLPEYDSRR